uniref:Uncharacterized protein n=1 Tax=Bos mutus grunniens TaxID=30521 RepID=A0A8B9WMQ6_BOSMU
MAVAWQGLPSQGEQCFRSRCLTGAAGTPREASAWNCRPQGFTEATVLLPAGPVSDHMDDASAQSLTASSAEMGCGLNKLEKRDDRRPGNIYSTLKRPQVETKIDVSHEYRFLEFTTLAPVSGCWGQGRRGLGQAGDLGTGWGTKIDVSHEYRFLEF